MGFFGSPPAERITTVPAVPTLEECETQDQCTGRVRICWPVRDDRERMAVLSEKIGLQNARFQGRQTGLLDEPLLANPLPLNRIQAPADCDSLTSLRAASFGGDCPLAYSIP